MHNPTGQPPLQPFVPLSSTPPTHTGMLPPASPAPRLMWPWIVLAAVMGYIGGALSIIAVGVFFAFGAIEGMLAVQVDEPRRAVVGEPFALRVAISNPGSQTVNFSDLDIPDDFFDHFQIESLSPAASSDSPVRGFGTHTYYFETDVQPGATEHVELMLQPINAGSHLVQFDVCSSGMYCSTIWRTVEVSVKP
jgi:hypothetical protein